MLPLRARKDTDVRKESALNKNKDSGEKYVVYSLILFLSSALIEVIPVMGLPICLLADLQQAVKR